MKLNTFGFTVLVPILLVGASYAQEEWANIATSGTLTDGQVCYTNGLDVICDESTPTVSELNTLVSSGGIDELNDIGDVSVSSPSTNDLIHFDGTNWSTTSEPTVDVMFLSPDTTAGSGYTEGGTTSLDVSWDGEANITAGTITGITDLAIEDGGTGASTATAARTNLGLGSAAEAALIDDDDFSSATSSNIPSAESVKAYVDAEVGAGTGDAGTLDSLDSAQFLRSDADDTSTGALTVSSLKSNGAMQVGISASEVCSTAADLGKMKYDDARGKFQICR